MRFIECSCIKFVEDCVLHVFTRACYLWQRCSWLFRCCYPSRKLCLINGGLNSQNKLQILTQANDDSRAFIWFNYFGSVIYGTRGKQFRWRHVPKKHLIYVETRYVTYSLIVEHKTKYFSSGYKYLTL